MKNKSRFFLITQVFYPDEVSTANLFTNLCSKISENEYITVKVWCAQPSYSTLKRQPKHIKYNNIDITFLASTSFKKDFLVGRLSNYLTFTFSVVFRLLFAQDKTPVFTHTTPPSLGIIIAFICRLKGRKFNYVLLDIFPDGLIRLGKMREKNIIVRIWRALHRKALSRCNQVIVIGRDMKEWVADFVPEISEKIKYIPIWQDENLICTLKFEDNPFVFKYGLSDKFIVQYSGNMGLWNDMRNIGDLVNQNLEGVTFMFIGGGMRKKELVNSFRDKNPENVIMMPFLSNKEYSASVSACHIAIVSLAKGLEGMAVPSKIMGIMAAGIPVIAVVPKESEIAYIVEEEDCGVVVDLTDTGELAQAILMLKQSPALGSEMGANGRRAFEKKYTTSIISKRYISLLEL